MKCPFCNKNIQPIYEIVYIPKKKKKKRRKHKNKYRKEYKTIGYKIEEHKEICNRYLKFKQQSNDLHS